jgi:protein-S-isoprenylcysteine O-methyltransferase Ste14
VKRRALSGLVSLLVILGLLLFLPAWSLHFWEAWIFWLIFSVSVTIITIYFLKKDPKLVERRLKAGPSAEKEKAQKIIQAFASLFFIMVVMAPGFDHRFQWSYVPPYLVIIGDVFVMLGFLIVFLVFKENSYTSSIIEADKDQTVISTGPYRIVRHPMYAGALLMLLFTPIALGSFWALFSVLPMFAVIVWRLLEEEKFLAKNLPGYKDYCLKTRYRLAPFVW